MKNKTEKIYKIFIIPSSDDERAFEECDTYNEAIKLADKLDITEVHHNFDADVFFPEIDTNIWKEDTRIYFEADEKNKYNYSFVSYLKKE